MNRLRRLFGRERKEAGDFAVELGDFDRETIELARPFTMTSPQRLQALILAVRYVAKRGIAGSIVECGVWRGGSMLAAARTLCDLGDRSRDLYLYDTYEGMPEPGPHDVRRLDGASAVELLESDARDDGTRAVASLDVVKRTLALSGYAPDKMHMVVGKVEDTIPQTIPSEIALLRLDTDWYESTKHELHHLYPLLQPGGVLIIDDYGWWEGARRAVDEYFATEAAPLLFNVIDETGRIAVRV